MRDYVDKITNKFLAWELPDSVKSDICATIPEYKPRHGTNLLNCTEARLMVVHLFSELLDEHENLQKFTTQYEESARDWKANYEEVESELTTLRAQLQLCKEQRNKFIKKYWSQKDSMTINQEKIAVAGDCRTYDIDLELQKKGQGE